MSYFINCSNHCSENWSQKQKNSALQYGEIIDIPFPNVDPESTPQQIDLMAIQLVDRILKAEPNIVMLQGESTLTYKAVCYLKEKNIPVLSACSRRNTIESIQEDGSAIKTVSFSFIGFRSY